MKVKILFGEEARQKLLDGMEKVFKSVAPTLGSRGKNAAMTRWQKPIIINDGVSIARKIMLEDQGENMGAEFIKEVAENTNEEAGDGTTTATILAYSLITEGFKMLKRIPEKLSAMQLRSQLQDASRLALEKLSSRAIQIKDDSELTKIAKISSENDVIADMVVTAFKKGGDTGRVVVEESQGVKTEIEDIPGMEIEGGYVSPYFITDPQREEAMLENVYVLVSNKTFALQNDIVPLMEEVNRSGCKNLVIVCKDAQAEALGCMIANKLQGKFNIMAVKAPHDKEMLTDLANFCGRQDAWTDENSIQKPSLSSCTKMRKIIAYKDRTLFIKGDRGDTEKSIYNARVEVLKGLQKDSHGVDKVRFEDRLARITSSVVLIKVGASSSAEIIYQRLKIEDAVNAVKSAVKEGYVTGGGVTLADIGLEVLAEQGTSGADVLRMACQDPVRILIENSGGKVDFLHINATDGFNTDSGKYEKNLLEKGIIDPVLVEKRALSNAVALAGMVLTLETLIMDIPEKTQTGV